MKKPIFLILFGTLLILGLNSCPGNKDEETPCSVSWATELQSQSSAMITAGQAYGTNPTAATCNAYKNAIQAYIDALKPYGNCATLAGQLRTDWQTAISTAEASVASMECPL